MVISHTISLGETANRSVAGCGAAVAARRLSSKAAGCNWYLSQSPGVASGRISVCWAHRASPSSHSAGLRVFAERDVG